MADFLSVQQASALLGVSAVTIQRHCKEGSLPAVRVGKQFRIDREVLDAWLRFTPAPRTAPNTPDSDSAEDLMASIDRWLAFLKLKELSPRTIECYKDRVSSFIKRVERQGKASRSPARLFARDVLLSGFEGMASQSASQKLNTVNALLSLGRYLVTEGKLKSDDLAFLPELRPSRSPDPRRTCLKAGDVPKFFHAIALRTHDPVENVTFAALAGVMLYGGLRVSEACALRLEDVNMSDRIVAVRHGKGRKDRQLGMRRDLVTLLDAYLAIRPTLLAASPANQRSNRLFLRKDGNPWGRDHVAVRMRHLSRLIGKDISAHGLRRTFATLASTQGRSMRFIQLALGHCNLAVTEAYLRVSDAEVAEAMKAW
ncbi:MAG: tyrosine-type recombinase/integrase [Candidatus Sericytochromatia bacterium]|nr:tyrosine-type recombinase/integrase [Candidatus Sericytochromatia bacterium]